MGRLRNGIVIFLLFLVLAEVTEGWYSGAWTLAAIYMVAFDLYDFITAKVNQHYDQRRGSE